MADNSLILGIETAIGGGSIALFRDDRELASLESPSDITRAAELLPNIDSLLTAQNVSASELSSLVVSIGPGSFTGIRVGIATALGLRSACAIHCVGLSALEAIAFNSDISHVCAAVPMGRDLICIQSFTEMRPDSEPRLVTRDTLGMEFAQLNKAPVFCHADAFELVRSAAPRNIAIKNIGRNLASLLCLSARSSFAREEIKPLFMDRRAFIKI